MLISALLINPTNVLQTLLINIMKKITTVLCIAALSLSVTNSFAQDAKQLKEESLKACDAQAAQMPESQRELVSKVCKCTVEKTDYESLLAKIAAGDATAQDDAIAVATQCQKDHS